MNPAAEEIVGDDVLIQLYEGKERALCGTCRGYTSETEPRTCLDCYFNMPESKDFASFQVYLETKSNRMVPMPLLFTPLILNMEHGC